MSESRLTVEIEEELKRDAQYRALQDGTSLKTVVSNALNHYLKPAVQEDHNETSETLEIQ